MNNNSLKKDELIAENARMKKELELAKEEDANVRHYLSVALGSGNCKKRNSYDEDRLYVYNWFEVFREVGKLLEKKRYTKLENEIESLSQKESQDYRHIIDMLKHHFPDKFKDFKCDTSYLDL